MKNESASLSNNIVDRILDEVQKAKELEGKELWLDKLMRLAKLVKTGELTREEAMQLVGTPSTK